VQTETETIVDQIRPAEPSSSSISLTHLVSNICSAIRILLVGVLDSPYSACSTIVIRNSLLGSLVQGLLVVETVPVIIAITAHGRFVGDCVDLDDLVVQSVQHWVDPEGEQLIWCECQRYFYWLKPGGFDLHVDDAEQQFEARR